MAAIRIEYCAHDSQHIELKADGIELKADGTIELFVEGHVGPVALDYRQSSMLKAMILAEADLQRQGDR